MERGNANPLSSSHQLRTLTVAGITGERRAQYEGDYGVTSVTVSGTGLSSGSADLYLDGSWARTNATLVNGQSTYTATAQDTSGRSSQNTVTLDLPASSNFGYGGNGSPTDDGERRH